MIQEYEIDQSIKMVTVLSRDPCPDCNQPCQYTIMATYGYLQSHRICKGCKDPFKIMETHFFIKKSERKTRKRKAKV